MNEPTPDPIEGGCLCGRVRYRLADVPTDIAHCHCRLCQRSTGAPVVTWATVESSALRLLSGEVAWYRSSPAARRGFCPVCGTQLFFAAAVDAPASDPEPSSAAPSEIDVTVASLDEPDLCRPDRNIWVGSRRAFLHGFDRDLPDRIDEGPRPAPLTPAAD
ncbi:MAG: GFA family protein [Phyllobacteriaceae bacterium]|nr:GFA family protein [Phyllobacteriaceae bacterium]